MLYTYEKELIKFLSHFPKSMNRLKENSILSSVVLYLTKEMLSSIKRSFISYYCYGRRETLAYFTDARGENFILVQDSKHYLLSIHSF